VCFSKKYNDGKFNVYIYEIEYNVPIMMNKFDNKDENSSKYLPCFSQLLQLPEKL